MSDLNRDNVHLRRYIHQLNNMLTVIQANAELIKIDTNMPQEVEDILNSCSQCQRILQELKQLADV